MAGVYAFDGNLSSKTRLFDFDIGTANQIWCSLAQSHDDSAIFIFGYGQRTYTYANNMMPTSVYIFDPRNNQQISAIRKTKKSLSLEDLLEEGGGVIGAMPEESEEEEDTFFVF